MPGQKKLTELSKETLYLRQNLFYESAYDTGVTPWSGGGGPSPELVQSLKKSAKKLALKRALDLGCGNGRHSVYLHSNGFKVIGIEYQSKALLSAQGGGQPGLLYVQGDIYRAPLKEKSFDVVIDYGVFHHIRRRDTAVYIDFLESMLIPGGLLFLECFGSKFKHGNGKIYKRGYVVHKNHYDRFSGKSEIRRIFSKNFTVLELDEKKDALLHAVMRLRD